jgi:hypothetical protein
MGLQAMKHLHTFKYRRLYTLERRVEELESLLLEGKRDQEILNNFLGDDYYNKFQIIKNKIKDPEYKDIYKIIKKDPDDVKSYIDTIQSSSDKRREDKKGAQLLYEDDDWKVYRITTYPAAQLYGKNTKWCITGRYPGEEGRGEEYFNEYIEDNDLDGGYYFYLNEKDPSEKYCVLQTTNKKIHSIWDASDSKRGSLNMNIGLPYIPQVNFIKSASLELCGYTWTRVGELNGHSLYLCYGTVRNMAFNDSSESNKWSDSSIRRWLNSNFYNTLLPEEKSQIVPFNGDRLFLLSKEEYKKFEMNIPIIDKSWWLRSPGSVPNSAYYINYDGNVRLFDVDSGRVSVRPAVLLDD